MTDLKVTIFSREFEPLGILNKLTALRWTERFYDFGDFELWCPLTEENAFLLRQENLVWIETDALGVIEGVIETKDSDGGLNLHVFGRFIEVWLERRIVWEKYSKTDKVSNLMRELVNINIIEPTNTLRKIPGISLYKSQIECGPTISIGVHRTNLWEALMDLCLAHWITPRLISNVKNKTCEFKAVPGVNRSIDQNINDKVLLSSELSDILSSEYTSDFSSYKNTALVAGAGDGKNRKESIIGPENTGLDRREMSVDARDISDTNTVKVDDGQGGVEEIEVPIADSIYDEMLQERGKSYIAENRTVESFSAKVRVTGIRAYTYGEDYFLGDRITVQDKNLLIQISPQITEVEQTWDEDGHTVTLTLGNAAPTIKKLIAKRS